jgi:DNA polymerase elongation subunit (family B)
MLFEMAHSLDFVYNTLEFTSGKCQGATVIEPIPGYYLDHVATLDYNSLYPSCIIMGNLCPSTLIMPDTVVSDSWVIKQVLGHRFVQNTVGIIPLMLSKLLQARTITKRLLSDSTNDADRRQLNYRQLALKLCANSAYGYLNSPGMYRCLPVAESTTALGRIAIETAKEIAEGAPYFGRVIYGDTDSVMIRLPGVNTLEEDSRIARQIADHVTGHYEGKLVLEPEKIYCPYLLAKKKRYCGLMYTSPSSKPTVPDCKGFEYVRKDTFPFFHNLQASLFAVLVAPFTKSSEVSIGNICEQRRLAAMKIIADAAHALESKTVPFAELLVSKSLRKLYKNEESVIQAVVNNQIKLITPGREFPPGDRVPFFIVNGSVSFLNSNHAPSLREKNNALTNRAVFSDFFFMYPVFSQNLDWNYYLDRMRPSIIQIMGLISRTHLPAVEKIFQHTSEMLKRSSRTFTALPHRDISSFFGVVSNQNQVDVPNQNPVDVPNQNSPPILFQACSMIKKPSSSIKKVLPKRKKSQVVIDPKKMRTIGSFFKQS